MRNEVPYPPRTVAAARQALAGGGGPHMFMGARPVSLSGLQPRGSPAGLRAELPPQKTRPALSALLRAQSRDMEFYKLNKVFKLAVALSWVGPWSWWGRGAHLFSASVWAIVIWTRLPHLRGPSQDPVRGEVACPGVEWPRFDPEPTLAGALGSSRGRRACPLPTPPRGSSQALGPMVGLGQYLAVPLPEASARMGLGTEPGTPTDLPLTCQDSCQSHLRRPAPQTAASRRPRPARIWRCHPRLPTVCPLQAAVWSGGPPAGTTPSFPAVSPASCAAPRPPRTTAGPTCWAFGACFVFGL